VRPSVAIATQCRAGTLLHRRRHGSRPYLGNAKNAHPPNGASRITANTLVADEAFDTNAICIDLDKRRIKVFIPPNAKRTAAIR
jgi:hypothetical protein